MIRVLLIFVIAALVAGVAVWIADRPGVFYVEWQDREIQGSVGGALLVLLVFVLMSMLATYLYFVAQRVPAVVQQKAKEQRQNRGLDNLTKGLIALSTGDAAQARRHAKQTSALLGEQPLSTVLLAQSAQANGDTEAAKRHYETMLKTPSTELLGLQGLIQHAIGEGNHARAIEYAERAYRLKPKSPWAYKALVQHQANTGNWDAALETVEHGSTAGVVDLEAAKRKKGVFLTAKASQAFRDGNYAEAEALSVRAQRLFPGFTPAAIMAANALGKKGNHWTAAGTLEEAWREEPHPAILESYVALKQDESARARKNRLIGLVEMRPDHLESKLLEARLAINTRQWAKARAALSGLLEAPVNPRVAALMAEIAQGDGNDEGAAREWMARAVSADPEPDWLHTDFNFGDAEWAALAALVDDRQAQWPPRELGVRKKEALPSLNPYGPALRDLDSVEDGDAETQTDVNAQVPPHNNGAASGDLILKSAPVASERVSAPAETPETIVTKKQHVQTVPARPKPQQTRKKKLKLGPVHRDTSRRGTQLHGAGPVTERAAPAEASGAKAANEDLSLPRQPDDPGPVT